MFGKKQREVAIHVCRHRRLDAAPLEFDHEVVRRVGRIILLLGVHQNRAVHLDAAGERPFQTTHVLDDLELLPEHQAIFTRAVDHPWTQGQLHVVGTRVVVITCLQVLIIEQQLAVEPHIGVTHWLNRSSAQVGPDSELDIIVHRNRVVDADERVLLRIFSECDDVRDSVTYAVASTVPRNTLVESITVEVHAQRVVTLG